MAEIGIKDLLQAGVHFGHQTRRWNPRMARFIHGEHSGVHVIDLLQTVELLASAQDFVSGWRRSRQDALVSRKIPSRIANRLVARISGVPLHDFGCTMKAYRRRVLAGVRLYGEMHRFIPIFAAWQGARVTEQVVNHRARTAGKTKYGLGRTFNVVLDLILIRFLQKYSQRPIHFFGRFGLWSFAMGIACFFAMVYYKYVYPWPFSTPPKAVYTLDEPVSWAIQGSVKF